MADGVRVEQQVQSAAGDARARLADERARLLRLIAAMEAEGLDRESEADSIGEIAAASQHPGDVGSETFERERDLSVLAELRAELTEVDAAVHRLAAGTYGVCGSCGEPIDLERLRAVPATRCCKSCQDRFELDGALANEPAQQGHGTVADVAEFLPDDDLEPLAEEPVAGPEGAAVTFRGDVELSGAELRDELVAEGALEDAVQVGDVAAAMDDEGTEELDEEAGEDEDEDVEADLTIAIRRQLGLDEELEELEELEEVADVPAEPADAELPPRRADEFLCASCFQLKRRTQLADPVRSRCVDCAGTEAAEARAPTRR